MNGIDVLSAPILLLLSVISFIIHFRNERRKSLIERPFFAASVDLKKKKKTTSEVVDVVAQNSVQPNCTRKLCRYCPISSRPSK
ncbi:MULTISPECIES: hypothetical protein [Serratia]|jgi:hypothetical protein|uniref:Uncharacterized protein n=1 Tax=Serratia fonticola TaxID=47917 RepID=A0AAJ1YA59_SERFO|nr:MULTISPECIES: hypothetical protein [Serratia]MBE0149065.1 hypothetical protein [Serratia fonticola]MDQ7208165.1 hypothetical protein [Serratia fonticola]MDQ9126648.1 hypothetical protein [Serratia fonticola]OKP30071.1 hypothetical protein BSQ40_06185 [Serratia fonticola]CAI2097944.1 Uncharacterised protein [Serratia fonticola]